ncbi:hypothetical protein [Aeoliella mucimassa]|uniref:Uncharacterized protein n=1 Tax=Aeoliella mucimassa TaxID=2527972 RepID=A0A518ASJ3_9BACT|nr:hypothetical protein [Aeoliella mucimassa]QDU57695.1 hypothetical protein Pan181_39160 [Aeoliella mucimassa]
MRQFYVTLLLVFLASVGTERAFGFMEFHKEWVKMYIDEDDESEEMAEYEKLAAKGSSKCLVCHQGKKKSNRNAYGKLFEGKLSKDDKKDPEKIAKVLEEVGKMKVDSDKEDSLTYDEVIAKKELPGGTLEELKEEPKEESEE